MRANSIINELLEVDALRMDKHFFLGNETLFGQMLLSKNELLEAKSLSV